MIARSADFCDVQIVHKFDARVTTNLQFKVTIFFDVFFLSFLFGVAYAPCACMPALRPASQAGPMRNPGEGTSVVLRDTIRLT